MSNLKRIRGNDSQSEFPSDVLLSRIMLSISDLLEKESDQIGAIMLATDNLEQSTQYMCSDRIQSLNLIKRCLMSLQLNSTSAQNCLEKLSGDIFLSLSIVIDFGDIENSVEVSKIIYELIETEMRGNKDSFQLLISHYFCETLIAPMFKVQYLSLKQIITQIIKSIPKNIQIFQKESLMPRLSIFHSLSRIIAEKQSKQFFDMIFKQIKLNGKNSKEIQVLTFFSDMQFPLSLLANKEIDKIVESNSIHLVLFDIRKITNSQFLNNSCQLEEKKDIYNLNFIHIFSDPIELICFFSNLRVKNVQIQDPTFVQIQ